MGDLSPLAIGGLGATGSVLDAVGARNAATAEAAASRYNAKLATTEGYAEEARLRREGMRHLASRRVAVAKSGLALSGTTLDALVADATTIELAALEARRAGLATAQLDKSRASSVERAGAVGALGRLLGGAAQTAYTVEQLRRPRLGGYS